MPHFRQALQLTRSTLLRLRALVSGDDRDTWYDDHPDGHNKPPNVAGNMWGSGSGGG